MHLLKIFLKKYITFIGRIQSTAKGCKLRVEFKRGLAQ